MTCKRFGAFCVLLAVLCAGVAAVVPANAETGWTAAMKIERTAEDTNAGTVTVRVSVEQITCQSGIFCAEYKIYYDPSILKLISWENSKPAGWNFDDETAEDWTEVKEDPEPYLSYIIMNTGTAGGVKRNGELYTDMTFQVLSDTAKSASVTVRNIQFADVSNESLLNPCKLPDQTCEIGLHGNASTSAVPVESSEPAVSESSATVSESTESSKPSGGLSSQGGTSSGVQSVPGETSVYLPVASEESAHRITVSVSIADVRDDDGVSGFSLRLKYNRSFLQYVSHTCITPENWANSEDLSTEPERGQMTLSVINRDAGNGAKEDGALGFLVEFTYNGTDFDQSIFQIEQIHLTDDEANELDSDSCRVIVSYEMDGVPVTAKDLQLPNQSEGSTWKIVLAVAASIVVLGAAVTGFLIFRKKRLA